MPIEQRSLELKKSNRNRSKRKTTSLLFFTNIITFFIGTFSAGHEPTKEPVLKIKDNEILISIPSKIFLPHQKLPMDVTIKTSKGEIVFKKAKLVKIEESPEREIIKSSLIVKKSLINKETNLNHPYFQITPFVDYQPIMANQKKRLIYEITF